MICTACGAENAADAKFCVSCGTKMVVPAPVDAAPVSFAPPVPAPADDPFAEALADAITPEKTGSPLLQKRLLLIALPLVLAAGIFIFFFFFQSGGGGVTDNISLFETGDGIAVSANNSPMFIVDGDMGEWQISMDGSKAVLLTDYSYRDGGTGTLWLITASGKEKIADDVTSFVLSDTGGGVAYTTDNDRGTGTSTLYLYDTAAGKATKVADEVAERGLYVCISPDGKTVSYITDYKRSTCTTWIKIDGKAAEKFGDNMIPMAIANGGKYIYYIRELSYSDMTFHVKSGNNDNRLASDYFDALMLNRDYSQAMIASDGRTYISRNGGERERISGSSFNRLLLPPGTPSIYGSTGSIKVYGVNSFAGQVAASNDGLAYINDRYEASMLPGTPYFTYREAAISQDGKQLLYINSSDRLIRVNPANPDGSREDIARHVASFVVSGNGQSVYYVNDDDELWYVRGNAAPVRVCEDVYSPSLTLSPNGSTAFFIMDYRNSTGGELCTSKNGGRKAKVPGGDEVKSVWSTACNIFYWNIDGDLYRSNGNEVFTLFCQEWGV